jgi:Na+/H+ antiporter NhaD/arsenite permease-like protein
VRNESDRPVSFHCQFFSKPFCLPYTSAHYGNGFIGEQLNGVAIFRTVVTLPFLKGPKQRMMTRFLLFLSGVIIVFAVLYFRDSSYAATVSTLRSSSGESMLSFEHPRSPQEEKASATMSHELGASLPAWSSIPFNGLLLSIALLPMLAPHFWHHHFGKVSAAWALAFAVPFLAAYRGEAVHEILHIYLKDYVPFIILLWALFTVAGGILVETRWVGTPITNTVMLAIGTAMASWIGTTGASMVMIRPMLRMNKNRQRKVHVVIFFIFLISNVGGSLTPLGDPPLFLGFLHGVPFFWTLNLLAEMLLVSGILLALFFAVDTYYYRTHQEKPKVARREASLHKRNDEGMKIRGLVNFVFLGGIIGAVLMSGLLKLGEIHVAGIELSGQDILRDAFLLAMGGLSLRFTARQIREKNGFTWGPILEVAYLFAGIFMTIIPMLAMLKAGTHGAFGFLIDMVEKPWHYFWMAGGLSSFLDNAPTYLTFFNTALGSFYPGLPEPAAVAALIANQGIYLSAIACGAVFMGANTYIGNAPNFMVKSIAEENGVKMPSFFGYMLYSALILIPSFILVTFVFF